MGQAPGFKQNPKHRIATRPAAGRVQVKVDGEVIADSGEALEMEETSTSGKVVAPLVYYLPRKDVQMERLARTGHHTYCPFKGEASYYSIEGGAENAAWSYERPYDEMLAIRELLSFYPDKVEIRILPRAEARR